MIEIITKELETRFNCRLVRLTGGYTHITFLMEGTSPLLVAKVAHSLNSDLRNEINCLNFLKKSEITPVIHDVLDIADMSVVLMDYKPGLNGQSILDSGELEQAQQVYENLGRFLATQIHSQSYHADQHGIRKSNASLLKAKLELSFVPLHLIRQSSVILSSLDVNEQNWVLTHGDYGSHNVLFEAGSSFNVLDWEWAEWGNALNDIAWVCWFTKLHYPEIAHVLNKSFIDEYISYKPIAIPPEQLKACSVYKVWNVLDRVRHASAEVQAEWVRRLEWTLQIDFTEIE